MSKDWKVNENIAVILGTLTIFGAVTIGVVALVYNRTLAMRASERSVEIETTASASDGKGTK